MALSSESSNSRELREKITVQNVSRSYESTQALEGVSLSVGEGEFCCIVGPSSRTQKWTRTGTGIRHTSSDTGGC
jgi:ABC-type nitrate/sulfonate/bicarbonate transport system, ATPase component